jgi:hypothetical protein
MPGDPSRAAVRPTVHRDDHEVEPAAIVAAGFSDPRFLGVVSADALAEAVMRTMDYGHDLDAEDMRVRLRPWLQAIEVVCARAPHPEAIVPAQPN